MYLLIYLCNTTAKISWGSTEGVCNMSDVTHVLTRNSVYEINKSTGLITRRTIIGGKLVGDDTAMNAYNIVLSEGVPLTYYYSDPNTGLEKFRTTSAVLSIIYIEDELSPANC